ncbi:MAG: hypothetical protein AB8H80_01095 [Planctomycetota bacterium]
MNPRVVLLPLLAAAVAVGTWWYVTPATEPGVPAATWRIGEGEDIQQATNWQQLPAGTPLRLSYYCTEARYLYVFSHSAEDGTLLLFPSPNIRASSGAPDAPANPMPTGRTVLPGAGRDGELSWSTRHEIVTATTFVAVAAAEPIAELEALLPKLRRWSNTSMTDGTMVVTNPGTDVEVIGKARQDWPHPLLQRAAQRGSAETIVNGPLKPDAELANVWTSALNLRETPGTVDKNKPVIPGLPKQEDLPAKPQPGK